MLPITDGTMKCIAINYDVRKLFVLTKRLYFLMILQIVIPYTIRNVTQWL